MASSSSTTRPKIRRRVLLAVVGIFASEAQSRLIVSGSHQGGYLPYRRAARSAGAVRPLTLAEGSGGFMPVRLDAGQACALDVRLVHWSGPNTADVLWKALAWAGVHVGIGAARKMGKGRFTLTPL